LSHKDKDSVLLKLMYS